MQTKKHSIIEILFNTSLGYVIAICSNMIVFPLFGLDVSIQDNLLIGAIFTVISIIRGYVVRRIFNKITIINKRI